METKIRRQATQDVTAPFDGYVVQLSANAGSAMVKEGDPLCTLVPYTEERAVQIWLDGNDAPLVKPEATFDFNSKAGLRSSLRDGRQ